MFKDTSTLHVPPMIKPKPYQTYIFLLHTPSSKPNTITMEPYIIQYKFFVVTKGRNTRFFTSFNEVSQQVIDFPDAEYSAFNCQATAVRAYSARLQSMEAEREELRKMGAEFQDPVYSSMENLRTISTANRR
ncbi:hypothetical protein HN51_058421 [Arachis hypogaea]